MYFVRGGCGFGWVGVGLCVAERILTICFSTVTSCGTILFEVAVYVCVSTDVGTIATEALSNLFDLRDSTVVSSVVRCG